MQTGQPYSSQLKNKVAQRDYNIIKIALNIPRDELHNRINNRVDQMIEGTPERAIGRQCLGIGALTVTLIAVTLWLVLAKPAF
jgi:hypothetical protein